MEYPEPSGTDGICGFGEEESMPGGMSVISMAARGVITTILSTKLRISRTLQGVQNGIGETLLYIILLAKIMQKMKTEGNDIFPAVPHGRNGEGDDLDTVVKVLAEGSSLYHLI